MVGMPNKIKNRLQQFIQQEQQLLNQLHQIKTRQKGVGTQIGNTVISEGAGAFAAELLESSKAGRLGRRFTKTFLDQKRREQSQIQKRTIESKHDSVIQSIRAFLSSVSIKTKNIAEPNSHRLVAKIDRAQEYVRIDTKIRRTVIALESMGEKSLIYSKDIPALQISKETLVSPGKPFTGSIKIKEILKSCRGYVKVIDPYINEATLELLINIPEGVPTRLLTAFTGGEEKEGKRKRTYRKFKEERPEFEIKKCRSNLIHDRFILTKTHGWNVGSSLKDFGKKLSIITELSTEAKGNVEKKFDGIWREARDFPV